MHTPGSEESQTRYSTPVSDLNDHRSQIPVLTSVVASTRREIFNRRVTGGTEGGNRPDLLLADGGMPVTRDFEHAIVDEDNEDMLGAGREHGSRIPSRAHSRRVPHYIHENLNTTRDDSLSDRSISPPNSVDAFAEPRRRERANTLRSIPSNLDLTLKRAISREEGRRPTFGDGSVRPIAIHEDRHIEEDIYFPQSEEPSKTFKIDFEELDEFVAEKNRGRPKQTNRCRPRYSFSSQGTKPKVSPPDHTTSNVPLMVEHVASLTAKNAPRSNLDSNLDERNAGLEAEHRNEGRPGVEENNRYSFFSSEIEQTIHAPELGDLLMPGETFRDLFELPPESGAWWLDVVNPPEDEIEMFQKAFGIHRLTAEDIARQEIREKVELFNKYYFVCFRSFSQMEKTGDDYLEPVNVYMVVFREGILTFTYAPSPHAADVRKRIGKLRNYINLTADWICYAMVDNIVDSFEPVIRSIELETDQIEDQVFIARSDDFSSLLRQIGECRKRVMSLMRLLGGKADVIKGFAKRCNEQYSVTPRGEIGLYLSDIQDHVVTMMSNLGAFEKLLSRSHSNYLAQLSVDNIAQGNRANAVLAKITLIATVLVPLNLVCGLFGMNVPVPGGNSKGYGWFFGILGSIIVIVLASWMLAKRILHGNLKAR